VDYAGKRVNLQKQNAAVSGFVMMQTSTFSFLMLEIVAIETMTGTHFVRIISMKAMRGIGKSVKNVGKILKPRCTYGMELTSITLKNFQILLSMSLQSVQSAVKLSSWVKMDILCLRGSISVKNAEVSSYKEKEKCRIQVINATLW